MKRNTNIRMQSPLSGNPGPRSFVPIGYARQVPVAIDWLILENQVDATDPVKATLTLRGQGRDRQHLVADITRPFRETELDIARISYDIFGPERNYYELEIVARDVWSKVRHVHQFFQKRRLEFHDRPAYMMNAPSVLIDHPWRSEFRLAVPNQSGVTAAVAYLVGAECLLDEEDERAAAAQQSDSAVNAGSLTRLSGQIVHYAAEHSRAEASGSPRFVIEAEIATANEPVMHRITTRLKSFAADQQSRWVKSNGPPGQDPAQFAFEFRDLGNARQLPTHFLPSLHCRLN